MQQFVLAYRPFIDPVTELNQGAVDWWWATLPVLALLTAVAYKASRMTSLKRFWIAVPVMAAQITLAMVGIGIAIGIVAELIVPYFQG